MNQGVVCWVFIFLTASIAPPQPQGDSEFRGKDLAEFIPCVVLQFFVVLIVFDQCVLWTLSPFHSSSAVVCGFIAEVERYSPAKRLAVLLAR